jgi:hypothetical protein
LDKRIAVVVFPAAEGPDTSTILTEGARAAINSAIREIRFEWSSSENAIKSDNLPDLIMSFNSEIDCRWSLSTI